MDMLGAFPYHSDRLVMAEMTDVHDFISFAHETKHLTMHLAHQRARRVDHIQTATLRFGFDLWRHAVRGKHHRHIRLGRSIRDLIKFFDEHRALRSQLLDHMTIVHDLTTHVHRRQITMFAILRNGFQNGLHRQYRPVHAGAETAWIGQNNALAHIIRLSSQKQPHQA